MYQTDLTVIEQFAKFDCLCALFCAISYIINKTYSMISANFRENLLFINSAKFSLSLKVIII